MLEDIVEGMPQAGVAALAQGRGLGQMRNRLVTFGEFLAQNGYLFLVVFGVGDAPGMLLLNLLLKPIEKVFSILRGLFTFGDTFFGTTLEKPLNDTGLVQRD